MEKANVFQVKARLSEYLDRAARGERIVICRHNRPVAELRAVEGTRTDPRPVGPLPGRAAFKVPASFFEPMSDEELALWEAGAPTDPLQAAWTPRRAGKGSKVAEARPEYGKRRAGRPRRRRR